MGKLMCPHCGNTRLFGMVKTSAEFEIERENGEDKTNELKVSSNPNNRTYEIMFCGKCKAPLTYEELTEGFICKECGTASPEVNEEGLCLLCQAKKDRKELFSLTKEELLRRFLSLEKEISRTDPKVAKGLEKVQEMKAQDTADDQTEADYRFSADPVGQDARDQGKQNSGDHRRGKHLREHSGGYGIALHDLLRDRRELVLHIITGKIGKQQNCQCKQNLTY